MTTRDNRGGPVPPDGVARVTPLPGAPNNRTDLSELPGTPGTPLPPNPAEPSLQQGEIQPTRRALSGLGGGTPQGIDLMEGTTSPDEPVTSGAAMGPGPGPEGLIPSPQGLTTAMTSAELQYAYPLLMRLAALPNATTETKILAQRLRIGLPVKPEQMPPIPPTPPITPV
jgi:hypothetical protein